MRDEQEHDPYVVCLDLELLFVVLGFVLDRFRMAGASVLSFGKDLVVGVTTSMMFWT